MNIAILDALPRRYWPDDDGYTDGEKIRDLLSPLLPGADFEIYYVTEEQWPANLNRYDGLVASGSAASVHDRDPWIAKMKTLLQQASDRQLKMIGICFSHQLIATIYGGEVGKNETGWMIGNYPLTVTRSFTWMNERVSQTSIHHFNEERVTRLPDIAESFVHSEQYPNFAYTINNNILCVQGHPEQATQSIRNWLVSMKDQMPDDDYRKAEQQVELGIPDSELWANWFAEFLRA